MFAFTIGEPLQVSQHKIVLRREAQKKWPFLTAYDLSTIHSEEQLASMVKDRTGLQLADVVPSVHGWVERQGKPSKAALPPNPGRAELSWENEGGASSYGNAGVATRTKTTRPRLSSSMTRH